MSAFPQHPDGRLKTYDEMTEFEREAALASLDDPLNDIRVQTAIIELYIMEQRCTDAGGEIHDRDTRVRGNRGRYQRGRDVRARVGRYRHQ